MRTPATLLALSLGALATQPACGARTGLRLPDVSRMDASVTDAGLIRFDACVAGRFTLQRRSAEVMLVLDRSGSMSDPLTADQPLTGTTRWRAMSTALRDALPRYQRDISMGALFFPRVQDPNNESHPDLCRLTVGTGVDIEPAYSNAGAIVRLLTSWGPGGATPTAAAVRRAVSFLQRDTDRSVARSLVLATDGVPNCNDDLDPTTCVCIGAPDQCTAFGNGQFCLDDAGAVAAIDEARAQGIGTYVIGIDGDLDAAFVAVLERMADAGGHARAGSPRYFSIQQVEQLSAAFQSIQQTVLRCAFVTPSRPDDPDAIDVSFAGAPIPRDRTHADGWDWTDQGFGELTLFGPACERVAGATAVLDAVVRCAGH